MTMMMLVVMNEDRSSRTYPNSIHHYRSQVEEADTDKEHERPDKPTSTSGGEPGHDVIDYRDNIVDDWEWERIMDLTKIVTNMMIGMRRKRYVVVLLLP